MADKRTVPAYLRRLVIERAVGVCEYCFSQEEFAIQSFSVEHIVPKALGGSTSEENLAYSCQGCNSHKAVKTTGIDPLTETKVPLYNPREQKWEEHFSWNEDCTEILGFTATGRVTVEALHLNRRGLVNLRRILFEKGLHPPPSVA